MKNKIKMIKSALRDEKKKKKLLLELLGELVQGLLLEVVLEPEIVDLQVVLSGLAFHREDFLAFSKRPQLLDLERRDFQLLLEVQVLLL